MGIANFHAKDLHSPAVTLEDLYSLLDDLEGILDWTANKDGEVIVEYDHNRISHQAIEEALSGVGLRVTHISDDPNVLDVVARNALDQVEV